VNPNPPPPLKVVMGVLSGGALFVAALALLAKVTETSFAAVLDALARFETQTGWDPTEAINAFMVVGTVVAVLATDAFIQLAKTAVKIGAWVLRQLGYAVGTTPTLPGTTLPRALCIPVGLWVVSVLVINLSPALAQ
jgi:hypothetical protein